MSWVPLQSAEQLDQIRLDSAHRPVLLFKHSTRCSISAMAMDRLVRDLEKLAAVADLYIIDVLNSRDISNLVAQQWAIQHESPQAILISHGQAVYHASHMDIRPAAILATLQEA